MRQNRLSQRLKSKLDSFGFDALIKGVSTLVEEEPAAPAETPAGPEAESSAVEREPAPTVVGVETVSLEAKALEVERAPAEPLPVEPAVEEQPEPPAVEQTPFHLRMPLPAASPTRFFEALESPRPTLEPPAQSSALPFAEEPLADVAAPIPHAEEPVLSVPEPPAESEKPARKPLAPEPLREALFALSCRLSQEAGRMAAALEQRDAEEAGFYLAHVNQILELLHTLDPRGDMARQLGVRNAPPSGRAWPLTAWTVVEFAESPFSALLPPDAGESFAREVIYAAWGISFAPA